MMIDLKLLAEGLGVIVGAKTEVGQKMLGPLADEIGQSLATFGNIFRFYQNDNLGKVFKKWNTARADMPIDAADFKKVLPLLQPASMQSDDELQARWAALMESTVSSTEDVLPSFAQTLSELNAEEAQYLDRIYAAVNLPLQHVRLDPRRPVSLNTLLDAYESGFAGAHSHAYIHIHKERLIQRDFENRAKLDRIELLIQDLERLGILTRELLLMPDGYVEIPSYIAGKHVGTELAGKKIALHRDTSPEYKYAFTPYGLSFVRAVAIRKPDSSNQKS